MSVVDQRHPVDVPIVVELKIRVRGPDSRVGIDVNRRLLLSSARRIFHRPSIGIFERAFQNETNSISFCVMSKNELLPL